MKTLVHVAVGVVIGNGGKILIAKRAQDAHQGGLWEFPGGKVTAGESVQTALARELAEELAIDVEASEPFIKITHDYGDKKVLLDVYKVTSFSGIACGNEGQPILWVSLAELNQYTFPVANRAIITALLLPDKMLITGSAQTPGDFLLRTEKALNNGLRLIQLRCPDLSPKDYQSLAKQMWNLCADFDARLLLNTTPDYFSSTPASGLHLNRHQLIKLSTRPIDTRFLLGASCHNAEEVAWARRIGADYITVSPIADTASHPGSEVLGWNKFAHLAALADMPVFALGGLSEKDIAVARISGAHGIAAVRCWWEDLTEDNK